MLNFRGLRPPLKTFLLYCMAPFSLLVPNQAFVVFLYPLVRVIPRRFPPNLDCPTKPSLSFSILFGPSASARLPTLAVPVLPSSGLTCLIPRFNNSFSLRFVSQRNEPVPPSPPSSGRFEPSSCSGNGILYGGLRLILSAVEPEVFSTPPWENIL